MTAAAAGNKYRPVWIKIILTTIYCAAAGLRSPERSPGFAQAGEFLATGQCVMKFPAFLPAFAVYSLFVQHN
jgi:hypothetical protein